MFVITFLAILGEFFAISLQFFLKNWGNFSGGFFRGFFWRIFLEDFILEDFFLTELFWWNFLGEIFWEDFFGRIFLGGIFWEDFLGGILWEELLSRNYQGIDVFVKILSQCTRKEEREFRSLEVRGKLIALKNKLIWLIFDKEK